MSDDALMREWNDRHVASSRAAAARWVLEDACTGKALDSFPTLYEAEQMLVRYQRSAWWWSGGAAGGSGHYRVARRPTESPRSEARDG